MGKLTDKQLVILNAASRRDSGLLLPLPKSLRLNAGAASTVLKSLIKRGLAEERRAKRGEASWREDDEDTALTLIVTGAGLKAIGIEPVAKSAKPRSGKSHIAPGANAPRSGTKQAALIALLSRKQGATIEEASKLTGWQAHSVRGAISGTIKKRLCHTVTSEKIEGRGRVYRIVDKAA
ncbi:DUF3489 domain-containing protein [bacterium AH-315-P15]|nr:DUF3489 domain-containing protein [bacterium AH-315-P15]